MQASQKIAVHPDHIRQLSNQVTEKILDELERLGAPDHLFKLVHSQSFFSSHLNNPESPADVHFFIAEATNALAVEQP